MIAGKPQKKARFRPRNFISHIRTNVVHGLVPHKMGRQNAKSLKTCKTFQNRKAHLRRGHAKKKTLSTGYAGRQ